MERRSPERKCPGNSSPGTSSEKFRGFTITVWTDELLLKLKELQPTYMCWAPETCPTSGKFHYQTYIFVKNPRALSAMGKLCGAEGRVFASQGNPEENRRYIFGPYSKNGKEKPINVAADELGTLPIQGKRNDLVDFHKDIESGKRGRELSRDHLAVRAKYPRLEETLVYEADEELAYTRYENDKWPEIHVRWGKPGVGKTRYMYDKHGVRNCCKIKIRKNGVWWATSSCAGKSVLIIDDFYGQMDILDFLQLTDKSPYEMEKKGGFVWRNHDYIYITSNRPPDTWYPEFADQNCEQILRRMTSITEVLE